jgi:antitoxin component YwqK of YwqJK toxin-antitoxin module
MPGDVNFSVFFQSRAIRWANVVTKIKGKSVRSNVSSSSNGETFVSAKNSVMKILLQSCLSVFFLLLFAPAFAQIDDDLLEEDSLNLKTNVLPELEAAKKAEREIKKAKKKKKVFFGIKTRRTFIKALNYQQQVVEVFNFARTFSLPNPYLREVYWFNIKQGRIVQMTNPKQIENDKASLRLMHGPYYRTVNGMVRDSGFYYLGAKHGRWEHYATNGHLTNKFHFHRGWYKHSQITYYDVAGTKIKEVIPIHHNRKRGNYYAFFENGYVAAEGRYDHDEKVGKWVEFYENRLRKKEIQYPNDPFDKETAPQILASWDEQGNALADETQHTANATPDTPPLVEAKKPEEVKKTDKKGDKKTEIKPEEPEILVPVVMSESTVKVLDRKKSAVTYYTLTPEQNGTNTSRSVISIHSPVGKELLGKKVGETAKIKLASGETLELKILDILNVNQD